MTLPEDIAGNDTLAEWIRGAVKAAGLAGPVTVVWAAGTTPETLAAARLLGVVPDVRQVTVRLRAETGGEAWAEVAAAASLRVSALTVAADGSVTLTARVTAESGTLAVGWAPVGTVSVPLAETPEGPFPGDAAVTPGNISRLSDTEGTWAVTVSPGSARFFRIRVAE